MDTPDTVRRQEPAHATYVLVCQGGAQAPLDPEGFRATIGAAEGVSRLQNLAPTAPKGCPMVTGVGRRHSERAGSLRQSGSLGRAMRWKVDRAMAVISHRGVPMQPRGEAVARELRAAARGLLGDRRRAPLASPVVPTWGMRISSGANHGRKSSKFIQDCTISVSYP